MQSRNKNDIPLSGDRHADAVEDAITRIPDFATSIRRSSTLGLASTDDLVSTNAGTAALDEWRLLRAEAEALQKALNDYIEGKIKSIQHSHTAIKRDAAQRVFGVPELLEHILLYLHPHDIFRAQATNKTLFDTIAGSMNLQRHLNLIPYKESYYRTPFNCHSPPWSLGVNLCKLLSAPPGQTLGGPTDFYLDVKFFSDRPKIGSRCRSILICQPPVYEITGWASCCARLHHERPSGIPALSRLHVVSKTGITVGDLLDAQEALIREHSTCTYARAEDHDVNGRVQVRASFNCDIRLAPDDPRLRSRSDKLMEARAHHQRFAPYIAAKRQGKFSIRVQRLCFY